MVWLKSRHLFWFISPTSVRWWQPTASMSTYVPLFLLCRQRPNFREGLLLVWSPRQLKGLVGGVVLALVLVQFPGRYWNKEQRSISIVQTTDCSLLALSEAHPCFSSQMVTLVSLLSNEVNKCFNFTAEQFCREDNEKCIRCHHWWKLFFPTGSDDNARQIGYSER